ncbi:MAG TPA: hypothetical protein VMD74_02785 [Candidatus Methylomirabilis sp.]|nr:hypothetical protein [Candidatus Methylomirabilis sp.]
MNLKLFFGIISTIIALVSFFPYLKDILGKKTFPHIYSWLVWSILQSVGAAAMLRGGASFGALSLAAGSLFCITIFFLSFKYGTKNITKFDTICLIGAIITIIVWLFQRNPLLSIILVTVIDIIAFMPTYRKGFADPGSETISTYFLSALANFFSLLAIANYSVITTLYLSGLLITNSLLVLILIIRRKIIASA